MELATAADGSTRVGGGAAVTYPDMVVHPDEWRGPFLHLSGRRRSARRGGARYHDA
jgi:hypothetical protein